MALNQVGALTEGLLFQGMFFWLQAANLLRTSPFVKKVCIEHDPAPGVDDVAVFYEDPGVDAAGKLCTADYYQVKYHVDRREAYSSANLADSAFLGGTRSLLQRFYAAHLKLKAQPGWYRLYLISNWDWEQGDPLGPALRDSEEGALPDQFFSGGPGSNLGKIREEWRRHLGISPEEFEDFARRLRFGTNFFGRRQLRDWLRDRLARFGLLEIPVDRVQSPYDSLTQQFIINGMNEFDARTFRAMCEKEGLLVAAVPFGPPVIGIRSFMRCAERLEDECQRFVCVAKDFEGRHIRKPTLWHDSVRSEVQAFLADPTLRAQEHHLLLECHGSIAFLAGYELDRKSGAQVFPVQKGVRTMLWKPTEEQSGDWDGHWATEKEAIHDGAPDTALAISVTRDVLSDVRAFLGNRPDVGHLTDVRPRSGLGASSVKNADHAVALTDELAEVIRANRPAKGGILHLFIAAPNAMAFFLGQHRSALGKVQLYEFDFEGEKGGSYSPSVLLPS